MNTRKRAKWIRVLVGFAALAVMLGGIPARSDTQSHLRGPGKYEDRLAKQVRHELVMLPYYSIFDWLTFQVQGDRVILNGQVSRPSLRSDSASVVKKIEGVSAVTNNIQVLPLSPYDDRLRLALYRAIYGDSALSRYAIQPVGPIHIIVNRGHATLEGVVANETDRNIANIRANGVPGVFSVTNHIIVEK